MIPSLAAVTAALAVAVAVVPTLHTMSGYQSSGGVASSARTELIPCALIDLSMPVGVVNDKGMTASEFRACLQLAEKKGMRRIFLDIAAPAGRDDSLVGYLDAIKVLQSAGIEIDAFVREASAEGWSIALTCNRWVSTQQSIAALKTYLDQGQPGQQGQGNKGMQGRRKPPAQGGQMPGMGQGLGLSGGGQDSAGGSHWSRDAKWVPKAGWPAPSDTTLERLVELMNSNQVVDREPTKDRTTALAVFSVKPDLELGDRLCATQRELSELSGALRKSGSDLEKQETALKSVKQKDGPRAESLQKMISSIKSRMTDLRLKMAALRSQP